MTACGLFVDAHVADSVAVNQPAARQADTPITPTEEEENNFFTGRAPPGEQ